ncbi:MAG TPA: heme exporter protein CcmD [Azospirillaceae bacterium]|nr:heme exporter protein CcmD [Azospirillaceae bacterium]
MSEYFAMGGHAAYVWSSYAAALAVLAGMLLLSLSALRRSERELKTLEAVTAARRPRRRKAGDGDATAALTVAAMAATAGVSCDAGGGDC